MNKKIGSKLILIASLIIIVASCKTSPVVSSKIGVQLWGENCSRCHYAPSPSDFSDGQWEVIGTHMMVRSGITNEERIKIVEFLKSAN